MTKREMLGEIGYCLELLRTRGNRNVPEASVESYLKTQAINARDTFGTHDQACFEEAADAVSKGQWSDAMTWLNRCDALTSY